MNPSEGILWKNWKMSREKEWARVCECGIGDPKGNLERPVFAKMDEFLEQPLTPTAPFSEN